MKQCLLVIACISLTILMNDVSEARSVYDNDKTITTDTTIADTTIQHILENKIGRIGLVTLSSKPNAFPAIPDSLTRGTNLQLVPSYKHDTSRYKVR